MLEKDIRRSNEVSNKLKQIKYLEDKVWGEEMGKWNWLEPLDYYKELNTKFPKELITVSRKDMLGLSIAEDKRVVGLAIISPLDEEKLSSKEDVIQNERKLDSLDYWTTEDTNTYNLFVVIVDPIYRDTDVISELMTEVANYFSTISREASIYATGVSEAGHKLLSKYGRVIAEKEENRKVYKLSIDKLITD
ncbi:hypothetical protein R2F61_07250 [Mollicutes bacterium LVI A0078]|nr:hypothetical protein RZE84_01880 [Mollicutes bacterium LVI A0075]WOO90519.1 hypothetical protein R2F61_07250 [Mollicutes bacterium LVI A0078]